MNLIELRTDCAIKQKRGLHFILASVVIWCAVLAVHLRESGPVQASRPF